MSDTLTWLERASDSLHNTTKIFALLALLLTAVAMAKAQTTPAEPDASSRSTKVARGVLELNAESGWAFRLPDAHATIGPPEGPTATARLDTTKLAPSAGVRFWATPWVGVSVDVLGVNSGSASARLDPQSVTVRQHFVAVYIGAEAQRSRGPIRPYFYFGGGPLRVWDETTYAGQGWLRLSRATTAGTLRTGGGVRFMCSRRWGVKLGTEILHYSANSVGANTFGRATAGFFFQTRGRAGY